jgi:hypothetical protein
MLSGAPVIMFIWRSASRRHTASRISCATSKASSSRWIHEELRLAGFAWQEGYGAFTFAAGDLKPVCQYVLNQEAHHRVKTFQEEYVEMLQRGMVEYDERYLW